MEVKVGSREHFNFSEDEGNAKGVVVKEILKLIKDSKYFKEVYDSMKINQIEDNFIDIDGANRLVLDVIKADEKFIKFDVISQLADVSCNNLLDKKNIELEFANINDDARLIVESDSFKASSKYSVKTDYLDKIYNADKFLNYCLDKGYDDFIKSNIDYIENHNDESDNTKRFRILKDDNDNYFVRAITSAERYKDYNIKFSVFVALIALYRLSKIKKEEYYIRYYSISESDIRVVFSGKKTKQIMSGVNVGFELELVNDEIKRESVKFNGLFSLSYGEGKTLSLKPDIKSKIISFPHTVGVKKVSAIIENLPDVVDEFTSTMHRDIEYIKKSNSPEELKKMLEIKVRSAKMKEFREGYKQDILDKLEEENVDTFIDLLDLMNKMDLLIDDSDIKVKDYWRYKLYEVLVKSKTKEIVK